MIDVPARVKDALRSGDFKKEYKIITYRDYEFYDTMAVDIYPSSQGGDGSGVTPILTAGNKYKISRNQTNGFANIVLTGDGNSYRIIPDVISTTGYTYVEFIPPVTGVCNLEGDHFGEYPEPITKSLNIDIADQILIDNDHLVSETVKFDERMCSDSELKFGLCEGTSIEFQYFDIPNIRGQQINVEIEIEYEDEHGELAWHMIPMGWFDVEECSRQASTGIFKATAYNKLKSAYLDSDCTARVTEIIQDSAGDMASVSNILETLLDDYTIPTTSYIEIEGGGYIYSPTINYTTDSGIRIYWPDGFEYDPPQTPVVNQDLIGKYFGIYTLEFYYVPVGETGNQTSDTYYYDFDFSTLWTVLNSEVGYNYAWQYVSHLGLYEVYHTMSIYEVYGQESAYLPIQDAIRVGNISTDQSTMYLRDYKTGRGSTPLFSGHFPKITIAVLVESDFMNGTETSPSSNLISAKIAEKANNLIEVLQRIQLARIYKYYGSPIDAKNITVDNLSNGITLRELQSASFEINCRYGKLDRVTDLFTGIELNNGELYPRDNLYPADNLYPQGNAEAGYPSMYSKLWADEGNVRSFRYLIITYKTTETIEGQTQEVEKTLQRTVNADGTDDYNMSDNWLFKNLVWTAEDVGAYADAMVTKMQNIKWFPFEMWCAGLPYLEAGDEIEITMNEGTYKSYVLRRTLNGIQNLQDEMINGTLDIF